MMLKLKYLIEASLIKKIRSKWFLITNILLALLIIGAMNIDTIIKEFGGEFDNETKVIILDDSIGGSDEIIKEQYESVSSLFGYEGNIIFELSDQTLEVEQETLEDSKNIILHITSDEVGNVSANIISDAYIDTILYQVIVTTLNNSKVTIALMNTSLPVDEVISIYAPITIDRTILDEEKTTDGENMETIMSVVFPIIILPFFMLSMLLIQMTGAEINNEKTTRGMEIIISNVSPTVHLFSKVIAGNAFVLFQGLLLLIFSGLGLWIRSFTSATDAITDVTTGINDIINQISLTGMGDKLILLFPFVIILMVLTFIGYSLLSGILASVTTSIEDFQQVQIPLIIISLTGYYLSMMASLFEGSSFIIALAHFPFISALLAPALFIIGDVGIVTVIISIIVMFLTNYLLIRFGLRVYKAGILNYTSKDLWKKMFRALKN